MNSLPEDLNDRLERQAARSWGSKELSEWFQSPVQDWNRDSEVDALVALARRFQSAPPLQVDSGFTRRLEGRILAHNAALRRRRPARFWLFPYPLRMHLVFGTALSLCMLVLLLGTGVLVAAAQASNPNNPLYTVKLWEEHVRISLVSSSTDQAGLNLQFAHDRLNTLGNLTDSAHAEAYRQALVGLDQQITAVAQSINALPAGSERDRLSSELATLKADARHTLRRLLRQLAWPERLVTTDELGHLGDRVPRLKSVEIALPGHPNEQATISITGDDLQPEAQLLVDGRLVEASGSPQNGVYVFVANWVDNQHPQSMGILNPDGTAAQTTAITLKISGGTGNGNSNDNGNGNGNGGKNPGSTPNPDH